MECEVLEESKVLSDYCWHSASWKNGECARGNEDKLVSVCFCKPEMHFLKYIVKAWMGWI